MEHDLFRKPVSTFRDHALFKDFRPRVANEAVAVASGDVGLSPTGRPDGSFSITMAGFERLVQQLTGGSSGGGLQLGLMAGLSFLGRPAEIDGKRAIALPLRFNDGAVSLGPLRLGKIDPLY